jgi:hypothetical protein
MSKQRTEKNDSVDTVARIDKFVGDSFVEVEEDALHQHAGFDSDALPGSNFLEDNYIHNLINGKVKLCKAYQILNPEVVNKFFSMPIHYDHIKGSWVTIYMDMNPLMIVSCKSFVNKEEMMKMLVESEASLDEVKDKGNTNLLIMVAHYSDLVTIKLIIDLYKNQLTEIDEHKKNIKIANYINTQASSGITAMHAAAQRFSEEGATNVLIENMLNILIDNGGKINAQDDRGNSPLDYIKDSSVKVRLEERYRIETRPERKDCGALPGAVNESPQSPGVRSGRLPKLYFGGEPNEFGRMLSIGPGSSGRSRESARMIVDGYKMPYNTPDIIGGSREVKALTDERIILSPRPMVSSRGVKYQSVTSTPIIGDAGANRVLSAHTVASAKSEEKADKPMQNTSALRESGAPALDIVLPSARSAASARSEAKDGPIPTLGEDSGAADAKSPLSERSVISSGSGGDYQSSVPTTPIVDVIAKRVSVASVKSGHEHKFSPSNTPLTGDAGRRVVSERKQAFYKDDSVSTHVEQYRRSQTVEGNTGFPRIFQPFERHTASVQQPATTHVASIQKSGSCCVIL